MSKLYIDSYTNNIVTDGSKPDHYIVLQVSPEDNVTIPGVEYKIRDAYIDELDIEVDDEELNAMIKEAQEWAQLYNSEDPQDAGRKKKQKEAPLPKWFDISDENLKVFEGEENKLLKAAEGYKGTDNIEKQLLAEAASDGITGDDATALIKKVMKRLKKTETGNKGSALGIAHNPNTQTRNLALTIMNMRY